ncbi:hypothetical protein [Bradyrhizobium pachyrhizi]|uniref:hypothetical protein n=1 Tax=Bradyrhizobium pachyrhizi TaxID=280333 RepID=UPI00067C8166|nr:hypothetical protein [Bradyrhizobium pachyrhizi]
MATGTRGTTARKNALQLVHYLRIAVNFNDAGIAAGVGKQVLPAGAVIIGTDVNIVTAFNAATTNVLTVGSAAGANADIVAGADVTESATGLTQNIKPTGAMLVPLAADTQVFAQFTQTGAAATAGKAIVIIKYVPDNDL